MGFAALVRAGAFRRTLARGAGLPGAALVSAAVSGSIPLGSKVGWVFISLEHRDRVAQLLKRLRLPLILLRQRLDQHQQPFEQLQHDGLLFLGPEQAFEPSDDG